MKDFKYWDQLSKSEKLEEFSIDKTGLLWLNIIFKVKSQSA